MNDAAGMSRRESVCDLCGSFDGFTRWQRRAFDHLPQRMPGRQFGSNPISSVGLSDFIDLNDVWMVQGASGASFCTKTRDTCSVACKLRRKYLYCNFALQSRITRAIDFAHGTPPDQLNDFEVA